MILTKAVFAKKYNVSRAAITQAVKAGLIIENASGHIDENNEINGKWISRHPFEKENKNLDKKTKNQTDKTELDEMEFDDFGILSIEKIKAEIRLKNEQADFALQKRLEHLEELIDRELVKNVFSRVSNEIKIRFVEMPKRICPIIICMVKANCSCAELESFIGKEISTAIIEIKKTCNFFLKDGEV